jgi:hypothetical protein
VFDMPDGRRPRQADGAVSSRRNRVPARPAQEMAPAWERRSRGFEVPPQHATGPHQADHSRWHWLLAVPVAVPLLTPLYNRIGPRLFGLPFFCWCQLAFVPMSMVVVTVVHRATRKRN